MYVVYMYRTINRTCTGTHEASHDNVYTYYILHVPHLVGFARFFSTRVKVVVVYTYYMYLY